jgi:hypothetical protein
MKNPYKVHGRPKHRKPLAGAVTSLLLLAGPAIVTAQTPKVPSPPTTVLSNPRWKNNQFSASIATGPSGTYTLERTTSLIPTRWTNVTSVAGDGAVHVLTDANATDPQRLYRVRIQ